MTTQHLDWELDSKVFFIWMIQKVNDRFANLAIFLTRFKNSRSFDDSINTLGETFFSRTWFSRSYEKVFFFDSEIDKFWRQWKLDEYFEGEIDFPNCRRISCKISIELWYAIFMNQSTKCLLLQKDTWKQHKFCSFKDCLDLGLNFPQLRDKE